MNKKLIYALALSAAAILPTNALRLFFDLCTKTASTRNNSFYMLRHSSAQ
ncbi:MAG: hypothetical protein HY022_10485 [Chloroflexi bacterium]|nr:hypothetical protein [Chloroflexota bacterium]